METAPKKTLSVILGSLVAFLLSAGVSYAVTSYLFTPGEGGLLSPFSQPTAEPGVAIDPNAPKTEECPINGAMFTKTEKEIWSKRRPLYVMIENSVDARPQSGLNSSDIVYEAVAEGGITRFGAVYYCGIAARDTILGPVRSARTHFVNWASEYNYPLYVHVGGANCSPTDPKRASATCQTDKRVQALEQINDYGWGGSTGNDLNQFSIGFPTFWRDYERLGRTVATEHTMYSSTEKLYALATKRGWTNLSPNGNEWLKNFEGWKFKDEAKSSDRGTADSISFGFWDSNSSMNVVWTYDKEANIYKRDNGGSPHTDLNTKEQLTTKNVVVQFIKETPSVDALKHVYYKTEDTGKALVFQDGKVVQANWKKTDREEKTVFTDDKGKPIEFVRGRIFIHAIPTGNDVAY